MLKISINTLLSLAVFIPFIAALLLIFGSPKCDSLANTTAYYLKSAIDEVSKDNFYSWDEGGVPSDISYYRTAPIMLCQDKGISYLETILGTTLEPQYKIYYEMFPEGGGGTWTEAYPWGGGAAATLRMWAYIRIGTGAFKIGTKYLTKASIFTTYMKKLYGLGKGVKDKLTDTNLDEIVKMAKESGEVGMDPDGTAADFLMRLKTAEAVTTIEDAANDGTLATIAGVAAIDESTNRIVLNDLEQVVEIPVQLVDPSLPEGKQLVTYFVEVYVRKIGEDIVDMSTDISKATEAGWELLKASPADIYNDWLDTLDSSTRKIYESMYVTKDKVGTMVKITGKLRDTNFYKSFYKPVEEKLKKFIARIDDIGYRVKHITTTTKRNIGVKLGFINAITENDDVKKTLLNQDSLRDKLSRMFGVSADALEAKHLKELIDEINLNGIPFVLKGSDDDLIRLAQNKIVSFSNMGNIYRTPQALWFDIINDPEGLEIVKDMGKLLSVSDVEAEDIAYSIIELNVFNNYNPPGTLDTQIIANGLDETGLLSKTTKDNLINIVNGVKNGDEKSAIRLAAKLGFVEQNKGTLPTKIVRSRVGTVVDYFKSQGKKMIYLDGPQNILNPNSFYARALFANLGVAGCEGNSLCVYSHTAMMEAPFYLNKTADKYFIRVWRPVEEWQRWAGWQAALKHVPEHPRFYVVSPCLATAKIWKTTYNNEPTIFVYPEKVSLEGESSNYCYADEGLIKTYTEIWLASDVGTIIQTVYSFGLNRALKSATTEAAKEAIKNSYKYVADKVFNILDPITLAQGLLEGVISWPSWPFKTLTWQQISANAGKVGIKEIRTGEQTK